MRLVSDKFLCHFILALCFVVSGFSFPYFEPVLGPHLEQVHHDFYFNTMTGVFDLTYNALDCHRACYVNCMVLSNLTCLREENLGTKIF